MTLKFDGKDVEVKGLDLNQMIEVEEKFGSLAKMGNEIPLKLIRFLGYLVIHKVRPELTEEQVGEKLDMSTIGELAKILTPAAQIGEERPLAQP
jgi:hypothetical protein